MKKYTKLKTRSLIRGKLRKILLYKIYFLEVLWITRDDIDTVTYFRKYLCEKI